LRKRRKKGFVVGWETIEPVKDDANYVYTKKKVKKNGK